MSVENCNNCAFWRDRQCHRHAPIALTRSWVDWSGILRTNIWPETEPNDYCGDFELKDAT